jgi:hypothetical protein
VSNTLASGNSAPHVEKVSDTSSQRATDSQLDQGVRHQPRQFETQKPGSQTPRTWFRTAAEPGLLFNLVLEFLGNERQLDDTSELELEARQVR